MAETLLNAALEDIEEVVVSRPELSQEEWEIVGKAEKWIRATLKPEVRKELDVTYAKKQTDFEALMQSEMQKAVKERMDEWAKSQEPLKTEDIAQLLNQEYVEFKVPIRDRNKKEHTFIICELPKTIEDEFLKVIQKSLIPMIEQVNAADWNLEGSLVEQIQGLISKSPIAFNAAVELAAIILNPWGEHPEINVKWISDNISIPRIGRIIQAQAEANKYRDFLSDAFRSFLKARS